MQVKILRGIVGAGKTHYTLGSQSFETADDFLRVVSADKFFSKTGVYKFEPARLSEAHAACFYEYVEILRCAGDRNDVVIVDNTNIHAWEIAPYMLAAAAYAGNVSDVEIITFWCDPVRAHKRNVHDVPFKVVLDMHRRLIGEKLPSWWAHTILAV